MSDALELAARIEELTATLDDWDDAQRHSALALKNAVEDFHAQALRRLIAGLKAEDAACATLKTLLADPMIYAMLRHHGLLKASQEEQVMVALDSVRPSLQEHGGDVELVRIQARRDIVIRLTGSCHSCGSADITLEQGVKKALREHCSWAGAISLEPAAHSDNSTQMVRLVSPFAEGKYNEPL